jgi:hypothetical protein
MVPVQVLILVRVVEPMAPAVAAGGKEKAERRTEVE